MTNVVPHTGKMRSAATRPTASHVHAVARPATAPSTISRTHALRIQKMTEWTSLMAKMARCSVAIYPSLTGSSRTLVPVAAKIALSTAGATGGWPGSPTPPIGSPLSRISTCTSGMPPIVSRG